MKLSRSGKRVLYSTYLGGRRNDYGAGIDVTDSGTVVVTGWTFSHNFPTTSGSLRERRFKGDTGDAFVAKVNPRGSRLRFSTFLGGSNHENGRSIALAGDGSMLVSGTTASNDFPVRNAEQPVLAGLSDAFVVRLAADGKQLDYATYLGGEGYEDGLSVVATADGSAHLVGATDSMTFPVKSAFQSLSSTPADSSSRVEGFFAKFGASGGLEQASYLGGSGNDTARAVALDGDGGIFIAGETGSADFPAEMEQQSSGGLIDAFLVQVSPSGTELGFSTYLGGADNDVGYAVTASKSAVFVTGATRSADFPMNDPLQPKLKGAYDGFVARVDRLSQRIDFSTFLGGSKNDVGLGADQRGTRLFLAGSTGSSDFPFLQAATRDGRAKAFLAKLN